MTIITVARNINNEKLTTVHSPSLVRRHGTVCRRMFGISWRCLHSKPLWKLTCSFDCTRGCSDSSGLYGALESVYVLRRHRSCRDYYYYIIIIIMHAFAGIRPNFPRGVKTRPPPLAFFHGVCSGGYLFSSGGLTPTSPPIFTLVAACQWCKTAQDRLALGIPRDRASTRYVLRLVTSGVRSVHQWRGLVGEGHRQHGEQR